MQIEARKREREEQHLYLTAKVAFDSVQLQTLTCIVLLSGHYRGYFC